MKKIIFMLGIIALIVPNSVFAGSPMGFDDWSATNGQISAGCAMTGIVCGSALTDEGFYQRAIEETSTGRRYFQTIITENGQTGAAGATTLSFTDESFVGIGRGTQGLADKQYIVGSNNYGGVYKASFYAENTILTGWATSKGSDTDVEFDFNQVVSLGFDTGIEGKNQVFDMRQRIADTIGELDMGVSGSFPGISYSSADYIRATWFNQDVEGQSFGWMKYENNPYATNDNDKLTQSYFSFTTIAPYDMNPALAPITVDAPFDTTL